jgi:hypothetical protein
MEQLRKILLGIFRFVIIPIIVLAIAFMGVAFAFISSPSQPNTPIEVVK